MSRARISTTVDGDRLTRCRELFEGTDSEMMDRALAMLLRELLGVREREILEQFPYDEDPELQWHAPPGPSLPYDGEIPEFVKKLAAERRAAYDT